MNIKRIKISILISFFILGIVFPVGESKSIFESSLGIIISFIAGIAYPYIAQGDLLLGNYQIERPRWSDKLNIKNPLIFAHMLEYFLFFGGVGLLIGELIQSQSANFLGLCFISAGFGIKSRIYWILDEKHPFSG